MRCEGAMMDKRRSAPSASILFLFAIVLAACGLLPEPAADRSSHRERTRAESIPSDAVKQNPADDPTPPVLHSAEFMQPVPLPGPVTTAGAEDSPFIAPDGTLVFLHHARRAGSAGRTAHG